MSVSPFNAPVSPPPSPAPSPNPPLSPQRQTRLASPVLNEAELQELLSDPQLAAVQLPMFFQLEGSVAGGNGAAASAVTPGALKKGLEDLCEAADAAVKAGAQLLVLSDYAETLVCCVLQIGTVSP